VAIRQTFSPDALRARRKALEFSREEVAFAIGRTVVTIANWECGRTTPSADDLANLARYLCCDLIELYESDGARV
jgi:transcriptional regulator with XRE-family HTH domain